MARLREKLRNIAKLEDEDEILRRLQELLDETKRERNNEAPFKGPFYSKEASSYLEGYFNYIPIIVIQGAFIHNGKNFSKTFNYILTSNLRKTGRRVKVIPPVSDPYLLKELKDLELPLSEEDDLDGYSFAAIEILKALFPWHDERVIKEAFNNPKIFTVAYLKLSNRIHKTLSPPRKFAFNSKVFKNANAEIIDEIKKLQQNKLTEEQSIFLKQLKEMFDGKREPGSWNFQFHSEKSHSEPKAKIELLRYFNLSNSATLEDVNRAYRTMARSAHPDKGGSHDEFVKLKNNYDALVSYYTA